MMSVKIEVLALCRDRMINLSSSRRARTRSAVVLSPKDPFRPVRCRPRPCRSRQEATRTAVVDPLVENGPAALCGLERDLRHLLLARGVSRAARGRVVRFDCDQALAFPRRRFASMFRVFAAWFTTRSRDSGAWSSNARSPRFSTGQHGVRAPTRTPCLRIGGTGRSFRAVGIERSPSLHGNSPSTPGSLLTVKNSALDRQRAPSRAASVLHCQPRAPSRREPHEREYG
jgi:hypothetical protein